MTISKALIFMSLESVRERKRRWVQKKYIFEEIKAEHLIKTYIYIFKKLNESQTR